jgi:hypothetical protein
MLLCGSGRAGARGGRQVKTPLAKVVEGPDRSTDTLVRDGEIIAAPPVAALFLAYTSPSRRGRGRKP